MTDVANQQQRPATLANLATIDMCVDAIWIESANEPRAGLVDRSLEVAAHQPEPVAVCSHFVLTIDGCDRVLQVDDRRHSRLDYDVSDPANRRHRSDGRGRSPTRCRARDAPGGRPTARRRDPDNRRAPTIAQGTCGAARGASPQCTLGDRITRRIGMRSTVQWHDLVEERSHPRDHLCAACRVVPGRGERRLDRIRAVERVVQLSRPGVGGVERVTGVRDRHHELRAGKLTDLTIDVRRIDLERTAVQDDVADRTRKAR